MDTPIDAVTPTALSQLVDEAHMLHFQRSSQLARPLRDELSSLLNNVVWLYHYFETTPDAMIANLQAILPEFHALGCAKGHLCLAVKAFNAGRYDDFKKHLTEAEMLHAAHLPNRVG